MKNKIELKDNFSEYALNEFVRKLREIDPKDYNNYNEDLNGFDLLDLLLEDEYANGCYYLYTSDNEIVFTKYFKDIFYLCDRFENIEKVELDAGSLLLVAMDHAFQSLLKSCDSIIEVAGLRFNRAGLDTIITTLLDMFPAKIEDLVFYDD